MSVVAPPPAAAPHQDRGNQGPPQSQDLKPTEEKHRHIGNYELLKTIGEGSFARVKLAIHRLTKQKVALKIIDKERLPDEYSLKNIHREAQIMRLLDHPHIIQLYEVMETKRELFLALEYAEGGELLDYIVARGRLQEKEARKFFEQIVSALEHCHTLNIVHRDLKAENLLLDENNLVKITDFGLSNVFDRSKNLVTCCGSPVYSAPELIEGKKYTGPEVDCWSLGINLYAMVVGDLPFADSNLTALYNSILRGSYHSPDYLSPECKDLISKLLERNPEKRLTITQARDHPWVVQGRSTPQPYSIPLAIRLQQRPRVEADLDSEVLQSLEQMGFERTSAVTAVVGGKFNQAAGTYYLLVAALRKERERNKGKRGTDETSHKDDIIQEYNRRKSISQTIQAEQKLPKKPEPLPPSKMVSSVQTGVIGPGYVNIPTKPNVKAVELSTALLHQQAAVLVPSTPPESKASVLSDGPLTDLLLAKNDQNKARSSTYLSPDGTTEHAPRRSTIKSPRKRDSILTIPIDPALYLDPTQDEDARDTSFPEIRTIRFAFNCQTTTSLTPDILLEKLKSVLRNNDVTWRFEFFLAECEWGDIKFEVEICKLPRMKTYGLRLKRNVGDMWDYKRLSSKICSELEV